ncbi:hypothetical protein CN934_23415 [Ensifer sp. MMN_5]|nr:hypothetical protein CN934_23415 [Ensifer sp. MMN_5]
MCPLIVADQWTKACSSSKCYSDLQSLRPSSCARHRDPAAPRLRRVKRFFQPKDLVWLDSCDKHRNEAINKPPRV